MKNNISSKTLTIRYAVQQLFYFGVVAGVSGFAATYLLEKGFTASQVGILLSVSNLLSCILQPVAGAVVDRVQKFILPQMITAIYLVAFGCFAVIQFCNPPILLFGLLYGAGILLTSISSSLSNSMCAAYNNRGYTVNYGIGTGVGSMAYSFASLGYGYVMAWFGVEWMLWIVLALCMILSIIMWGYPRVDETHTETIEIYKEESTGNVSLIKFFGKNRGFIFTMSGILLLAMCHTMSENYFIKIFQAIGGGSENVGTALFIACITAAPVLLFFEKVQEKVDIYILMRLSGIFFALKMLLLIFATEIWHIYLIELLQTFTYCFAYPPLYYMARRRIAEADLAKGQTIAVALYTLGAALGNYVGGRVIDLFGLSRMLFLAFVIAVVGTIIIHISLRNEK